MPSKTVTLYVDQDVIDKLEQFADLTYRSKSNAAEVLMLHGIANYDFKAAAPHKVDKPKKPTAASTRMKKNAEVKVPKPRGRKPDEEAPKRRGRPPKTTAKAPAPKRRGRPPKTENQEAA